MFSNKKNLFMYINIALAIIIAILTFLSIRVLFSDIDFDSNDDLQIKYPPFEEHKNVLLIHSYSTSYDTFYPLQDALRNKFKDTNVFLDTEFMDTKRFGYGENIIRFAENLEFKLSELEPYDAIIASDDNALHFVMKYREKLFSDIPIFFTGISDVEFAKSVGHDSQITGIVETVPIAKTINIAKKFFPDSKKVTVIYDDTTTGHATVEYFNILNSEDFNLEFEKYNLGEHSYDEFEQRLENAQNDEFFIFLSALVDKNEQTQSLAQISKMIQTKSPRPVFFSSDFTLNNSFVGGEIVSHYDMGSVVGGMILDVLNGKDIADIPVVLEPESRIHFDYNVMNKFDLSTKDLPDDSVIINKPNRIYEEYKKLTLLIITLLTLLVMLIFGLIIKLKYKSNFQKKLAIENNTDELTKINNRRKFFADLNMFKNNEHSFIFIDINNFKIINDVYGHNFGDKVLRKFAIMLDDIPNCTAYRIAGDEFAVITDNSYDNDNLIKTFSHLKYTILNKDLNVYYTIEASCGIIGHDISIKDTTELLHYADKAMYQARKNNTSCVLVNETLKLRFENNLIFENALITSVNNKEIFAYFQPIVSTRSGKVAGFELLARWKHGDNIVPAYQFIDISKEYNILMDIDILIVKELDKFYIQNQKKLSYNNIFYCINVSTQSLLSDIQQKSNWQNALYDTHIQKRQIIIEGSEKTRLTENIKNALLKISTKGYSMAIDDYGNGESNLNNLNNLKFEFIKTDMSLLPKSVEERDKYELFSNLVYFIHSLDKSVVVEGVETQEQFEFLMDLGVEYMQGYYFSKAVSSDDAEKMIGKKIIEI